MYLRRLNQKLKYMKKKLLLTIIGVGTFTGAILAQSINYGIKAGINVANVFSKIQGVEEEISGGNLLGSKIGFHGGGFVNFALGNGISIQPELYFSQLGARLSVKETQIMMPTNTVFETNSSLNIDYLILPALVKYTFLPQRFSVYAGPQIGFLLAAQSKGIKKVDGEIVEEKKENIQKNIKPISFAAILGAEYTLPMGIVLSARYQTDLTRLNKEAENSKSYSNAFSFTVGYAFNGKK